MTDIISGLNGYLWGFPMITFLFFTHLFFSVYTKGIQRKLPLAIKLSFINPRGDCGGISPFTALATTLASTLGTGNIIGVATAVSLGGPGAVFWCWITGVLGMATQYAEVLLCVKFRQKTAPGEYLGGPAYVIRKAVGSRGLSCFYAMVAAVSVWITGSVIQSNAIGTVVADTVNPKTQTGKILMLLAVGIAAAILTAAVIFGGLSFVGSVCRIMVPFMGLVYIASCLVILYINRDVLADSVVLIIRSAFSPRSAGGGFVGSTILTAARYGVARGLFSNEAGVGTSAVVPASANTPNPVRQGLVSMTATFWDTVVMCLVTGLVIVSSVMSCETKAFPDGGELCTLAFSRIPVIGGGILLFSMVVFAFSTIVGMSPVGVNSVEFLFGKKARKPYLLLWTAGVFAAPLIPLDAVWELADIFNAMLVIPNVYSLFVLAKTVKRETHKFIKYPDKVAGA